MTMNSTVGCHLSLLHISPFSFPQARRLAFTLHPPSFMASEQRVYEDGSVFEGQFVDGKRDGHGTFSWRSGDQYVRS